MTSSARDGWAARRARGCDDDERGKSTWDIWWACCPNTTAFVVDAQNNARCNTESAPYEIPDQCADPDLVLWWDDKGLFCCEPGLQGFVDEGSSKGCVMKEELERGKASMTPATSEIQMTGTSISTVPPEPTTYVFVTITSSMSSSTASSSASATSTPLSSGSQGSSTNTGAIAGGVVGGVCGALIIVGISWFLLRRRRGRTLPSKPTFESFGMPGSIRELDHPPKEAQLLANNTPHELPVNEPSRPAQQSPDELHG